VYGFNLLTPMDIHLPVDERASLDGNRKAHVVKTLHESVRKQIENEINPAIGFGCICARRDFRPISDP